MIGAAGYRPWISRKTTLPYKIYKDITIRIGVKIPYPVII